MQKQNMYEQEQVWKTFSQIVFPGFPEILELVVLHSETNFRPKWEVWKHYALLTFRELMGIRANGNLGLS